MQDFHKKQTFLIPVYLLLALSILLIGVITYIYPLLGFLFILIFLCILYFVIRIEWTYKNKLELYIKSITARVKNLNNEAITEMPIGVLIYNKEYQIQWGNQYILDRIDSLNLNGKHLFDVSEGLMTLVTQQEKKEDVLLINKHTYRVILRREEQVIYFFDVTEQAQLEKLYEDQRTVISGILLDNYDEITQGLDDQERSSINGTVTTILNNWANQYGIFLRRVSSDRLYGVLNEGILAELEKNKFSILDTVREETTKKNLPITLSIGVGVGMTSLPELGQLAQSGLDLALGRGGDQVTVKNVNGKVKFFGGKTNPIEKRTRVRARVISHALRDLMKSSVNVIVMGHKMPDMDAIGSAVGVLKMVQHNEVPGYIVVDHSDIDKGVQGLMKEMQKNETIMSSFISPEQAEELITDDTLIIIVDTHRPSMVTEEALLQKTDKIVVIDHHRRGEDFIKDAILVYMEPYASSTAELVTELLEYQPKKVNLSMIEATALLAGIIVDTKSFTFRTGARTFDAASYLRSNGADTILVQKLLKQDMKQFIKRAELIEEAYIYKNGIAISHASADEEYSQVLIAQAADTLLSMTDVVASFVIAKRSDNVISISSRSLGDVNVQLIMESLGGGGHLTNAATQIENMTIKEVELKLIENIDQYLEGGTIQ
ncbi:DHH family phosphoesterase [Bacillus sp. RG28]|uniref:Cyclic-di-AMP phosphodiesterase n=1 Tax=Gottfriedia endophytica TaxID=2820819 RepID=A0A940NQ88_9BACI|nr:DHH family phosphoesterase [Gottfriedia endophytica]MBP0724912.1 DHH family phosphoesterase [Gottfriedia endophytica]